MSFTVGDFALQEDLGDSEKPTWFRVWDLVTVPAYSVHVNSGDLHALTPRIMPGVLMTYRNSQLPARRLKLQL